MKQMDISLDTTFSALADPTRRAILLRLMRESASVSELAKPFHVSLPAVSKHIRILEKAGLVVCKKRGRVRHCQLIAGPMKEASNWMDRYRVFWESQLDALADYLKQPPAEESKWQQKNRKTRSKSGAHTQHRGKKYLKPGPSRNS